MSENTKGVIAVVGFLLLVGLWVSSAVRNANDAEMKAEIKWVSILHGDGRTSEFEIVPLSIKIRRAHTEFKTMAGTTLWFPTSMVSFSSTRLNHYQIPILSEFDDAPDPDGNVYPMPEGLATPTGERHD